MNHGKHCSTTCIQSQHGMTLVEILVALALSLLLLAGVMEIMLSSKQAFRIQDGLSRLQENARFAMQFLSEDLRMAGYSGCSSARVPNNIVDLDGDGVADDVYDFAQDGLIGFEYPALPIILTATESLTPVEVTPNTDIVVIMYGSPAESFNLLGNLQANNANIQLPRTDVFAAGDVLLISDCSTADIFSATNVTNGSSRTTIAHANNNNLDNRLSKAYGTDATVMGLIKAAYYVGPNAVGIPSLYRKRMVGSGMQVEELVEGVESMQLLYGEDLDADGIPNRYIPADAVGNFANVVSVRIGLLLRTIDEVDRQLNTNTYNVLDETVDPADDRRLRRIFETTIMLRNRNIS